MSAPGWYADPAGRPGLRYWDGAQWTFCDTAAPPARHVSLNRIVWLPFAVVFGGLGLIMAVIGAWKAVLGVAVLAVLVGAPLLAALLVVRTLRQHRQRRRTRREYEQGLIARFDQAARAASEVGADAANVPGPTYPGRLPDAERMRQQAWQPDVHDQIGAVKPANPAPWHIVTQVPTSSFRQPPA